jgi:uncharacterized Zn-binding protein involved in type VI secretion
VPPASRVADNCVHPNLVTSGSPDTIIGGMKAARLGDSVSPCPAEPTPPGMIVKGSSTVFINSRPAARIGDAVACGAPTVPPPGGRHAPVQVYEPREEDDYVAVVSRTTAFSFARSQRPVSRRRRPTSSLRANPRPISTGSASSSTSAAPRGWPAGAAGRTCSAAESSRSSWEVDPRAGAPRGRDSGTY